MERENLRILEKNIEILGKMEKPTVLARKVRHYRDDNIKRATMVSQSSS